jgi:uncharacterized protein YgfB (UPF0149 family)|tara:strand:- start:559 stop:1122 length:564 start_codon:yes stop_codon:yes gene_type:complete
MGRHFFGQRSVTDSITALLNAAGSDCGPAEFHGLIVAHAALVDPARKTLSQQAVADWLALEGVNQDLMLKTAALHQAALESLEEFSDFDLTLLLPDDSAPMDERFSELTCWCSGFLHGLGLAQHAADILAQDDIREMLEDLAAIARSLAPVPESEDNESDFMEILEYIRVVVLSIATESERCQSRPA